MILNKEDKAQLKNLRNHPGYRILERIEEEATNELGKLLLKSDLDKVENIDIIKRNQLYTKARRDFLHNTEKHLKEIYEPKV